MQHFSRTLEPSATVLRESQISLHFTGANKSTPGLKFLY